MDISELKGSWALILGASSGFGEAVSLKLAKEGMNIFGVHLDRKATLPNVERIRTEIEKSGSETAFFNINAAGHEERANVIEEIHKNLGNSPSKIRIMLHSLAFGTLKPFIANDKNDSINPKQMDMTLDVMAHSLVYWTQDLVSKNLFSENSRIFAMTSAGGHRIWPTYGAVSAAKAALESHIRQLSVELAKKKITANSIQAGVTDTPALRKIPGNSDMIENTRRVNPHGELTTPEKVANAIATFCLSSTEWMTGNVIRIDGGEDIAG